MKAVVIGNNRIRPVTYGLAVYFLLMAMDCFPLGTVGSLLKIVALIPLGLSLLNARQIRMRFNVLVIFQFLFWLLAVLSLLYTVNQSKTTTSVITLTLNLALVIALGSMQTYSETEVKFLYRAFLYGSWLTILLMVFFSNISSDGRLTLQIGEGIQDQNYINGYILFAFSYHCKMSFLERKWRHLTAVLFIMVVVLLTGSRGAFLAYIAVAIVYLVSMVIRTRNSAKNLLILLFVIIVAIFCFEFILTKLPADVAKRFSWDYISQTGTVGRMKIWRDLLAHFCDDNILRMLFGHGYGTTIVVSQLNKVAHNLYLDNLVTLGIAGLLLQIITQVYVIYELHRQKAAVLLGTYIGMLVMCLSLSLVAYKPIWNIMLFTLIQRYCVKDKLYNSFE